MEIRKLKNEIYDEEKKYNNLNNEIIKLNNLNQKLIFDTQNIINENFNIKNRCDELERIIQKYKNKEFELNKEKKIFQDKIDFIENAKINQENERNYI
jgi:hypothetical protein